jgi:5-methyltetrahydropteroyltriglutamate--homocysteine methyltransferase
MLKKRIEQAARFTPVEQLCLSPQCGFASSARSGLPMDVVERKLARIVDVADNVAYVPARIDNPAAQLAAPPVRQ